MQTTSALYQTILESPNHWYETKVDIDNVGSFGQDKLFSVRTNAQMFNREPTIGNAVSGEVNVKMLMPSVAIPRMAVIRPYVRICMDGASDASASEWLPQGVYFLDTRSVTHNDDGLDVLTIHGYDSMLAAEQDYPSTGHAWPYLDTSVIAEIASAINVEVDSRTYSFLTAGYMLNLPSGYTIRETLEHIAGMYCGNFIMSPRGKLLFVPLFGLDSDEWLTGNYLADENGNAITFGNEGWYTLV